MGISVRAYARHRGMSDTSIHKAIRTGRITALPDGTIDPATADAQWAANTDQSQQRTKRNPVQVAAPPGNASVETPASAPTQPKPQPTPNRAPETEPAVGISSNATFVQARTANEVIKAQTNKIKLAQMKGNLIDHQRAADSLFILARRERDALLNWPARIAPELAAELSVDPLLLNILLDRYVRAFLDDRPKLELAA